MKKHFMHPVERIAITGRYIEGRHGGIDYGWEKGHQTDSKVLAANDGTVVECEYGQYVGNYIVINHGEKDGKTIYTRYGHLRSFSVKEGDEVEIGQEIGIMGETGSDCYGVHLHFDYVPCNEGESFNLNRRVNPEAYLFVYNDHRFISDQDGVKLNFLDCAIAKAEELVGKKPSVSKNVYTVKKGDTMWEIAKDHNVSLDELIDANPQVKNPNVIDIGDKINIPAKAKKTPKTYIVKKGDAMWEIAAKYGVTLTDLEEANPQIENSNLIYPGQKINIPS
jgi:spore coat assembly protein SafA